MGAARTRDCQFHTFHRALTARRGYKRATVAAVHKLVRTLFAVLRDAKPYQDPETDYEALLVKRNAPRWIRMLQHHDVLQTLPTASCACATPESGSRRRPRERSRAAL